MNLTLSWDLFIIVFFALVVTYSFIIGKKEAVKIIIGSYIGIVAVQAVGNLLQKLLGSSGASLLGYVGLTVDGNVLSIAKLVLFIVVIVSLAIKAGFDVQYSKQPNTVMNMVFTTLFGIASAGLLLSVLLSYIAGVPLLETTATQATPLAPVIQQSMLMPLMLTYQDLWLILPAVLLIVVGFLHNQ